MIRKQFGKLVIAGIVGIGLLQFAHHALAQGEITVDSPSIDFGEIRTDENQVEERTVTFTNHTSIPVTVTLGMDSSGLSNGFSVDTNTTTILPANGALPVVIRWNVDPAQKGTKEATLNATFAAPGTPDHSEIADKEVVTITGSIHYKASVAGGNDWGCNASSANANGPASFAGVLLLLATLGLSRWAFRKNLSSR